MRKDKRLVGFSSDSGGDCFANFLDKRRLFFFIEQTPSVGNIASAAIAAAISACNSIITQKAGARQNTLALLDHILYCGCFVRIGVCFVEIVVEKRRVYAAAFERLLKIRIPR